jgi:hypothetical protein
MLRHNMTVITRDNRLKREVQRVTASTASNAQFILEAAALDRVERPDLVIFDARTERPPTELAKQLPDGCAIIYIVDEDALIDALSYLEDPRATSIMGHGSRFDDDEFIASATKALRHNLFGLAKYFPWGVTTFSIVVGSGAQKGKAIDVILEYARLAGVRAPVRDRIQTVADELMMNALYHAPVDGDGQELYAGKTIRELSQLPEVPAIEVQYGSSGRYFGISVRDGGGSLSRDRAMQYLARARGGTADVEQKVSGAGLGLVSVLRSVSKLIFNLEPGTSTEVIGLFDMELFAKGKVGARSIHVFTSDAEPEPDEDVTAVAAVEPSGPTPSIAPSRRGVWLVAAILLSVVTAMGTAVAMRHRYQAIGPDDPRCLPEGSGSDGAAADGVGAEGSGSGTGSDEPSHRTPTHRHERAATPRSGHGRTSGHRTH